MQELNRNESISIGTTAVVISKNKESNIRRENIIIINTSTGGQTITISIDKEAVAGQGIPLGAGGSWSDNAESGYKPTQKQISVISDLAGATIALQERSLQ